MLRCSNGLWTYSGNPGANAKDQTRFLIGDTDPEDPQLLDAEITWLLGQYNNTPLNAAIRACETIMMKYSRMVNESVGQVKIDFTDRMKNYQMTQTMLRARLATEDAAPYAGGILISDVQTNLMNSNIIRPDFYKHMMENYNIAPWTTQNGYNCWLWYGG